MIRTSHSHQFRIAELPVGVRGGAIGITFAPGKHQPDAMTGHWARDLDVDLEAIRDWGANRLISLIEPWEFSALSINSLPGRASAHGLEWIGLPITDGAAPDHRLLDRWTALSAELVKELCSGSRVVVHCKGGLGRAGTVACMLLLDCGEATTAEAAMRRVRSVRAGSVETEVQEAFLRDWTKKRSSERNS